MKVAKSSRGRSSKNKAPSSPLSPGSVRTLDPVTQQLAAPLAHHMDRSPSMETLSSRSNADEDAGSVSSVFARQVHMAYGLLQAAIDEVAETLESSNAKIAAEFEDLQTRAIRSIRESAQATIDLFEAIGAAQTPGEFASRQLELARRRHETVTVDFFESARSIVSIMTDPLNRQLQVLSDVNSAERSAPEAGNSFLSRLYTLTERQKMVLRLLAEGLPNKVISYRLGISETTVKAHVGEILRKLKAYNRARVIVMLAQLDMRQLRALPFAEGE